MRLLYAEAIKDKTHPMYDFAKEYKDGLEALNAKYPDKTITFKRVGYPKFTDGYLDPLTGVEKPGVPEPIPPMRLSYTAVFSHPTRGKEVWAVCLDTPKALAGGLWELGKTRSRQVVEGITLNLVNDADLAFFLCYKSPHVLKGHLKIDDPKASAKERGNKKRQALELETAIWQKLDDEEQLRKIAAGWGISEAAKKEPDMIREELEALLKRNDELKKRDPSYKGTAEFLEDMKITDYVRLSAFIRQMLDASQIVYKPDGRYWVGDKIIAHVPKENIAVDKRFSWLCNYFAAPNNTDKLQDLFKDLINREYLDSITDNKDFRWIAGVMQIEGFYNKAPEQVKEMVYGTFVL
jgi:hypothetical protein